MITKDERAVILQCAQKYNLSSVILFGSSIEQEDTNDIDIGIKGIRPKLFFKFYAELDKQLLKPVDVVDMSKKSLFNDIIEESGVKIYG